MMHPRFLAFIVAVTLAYASSAVAAVTSVAVSDSNNPRTRPERSYEGRQGNEETERFTGTYRFEGDGALDLSHISGDVVVSPGRGNEVRIEAIKRVRHRDPDQAKRMLASLRIEVTQVGDRIEVRTVYPRSTSNRSWNGSVDYTITLPDTAAVAVKTVSGDVSVSGIRGEVRAETVSGDLDVVATPNLAVAKSVSGDVNARDIASGSLTISTVSGTVIASALKVRSLDAGSVSGDLRFSNLQAERLMAKTMSGDIEFDGGLSRGCRYEFTAHSGNVRLILAGRTGFELDASTFSGSVRSDFPITLRTSPRTEVNRRSHNQTIRGTYGDAGAMLAARSFSGSVVITQK